MWARLTRRAWLAFTLAQTPPQIRGFYRIEEPSVAFGDFIRSYEANASDAASPWEVTVTISVAPTAGNLLVAGFTWSNPATTTGTLNDPSGWTLISASPLTSGNVVSAWYYKIADGTEASVVGSLSSSGGGVATVGGLYAEFEGAFAASPLDKTAEDETNISTVVTSQSSGTTAATAQASELAIAFFGGDSVGALELGRGYTNSFTERAWRSVTTGRPACAFASLVLSATGTQETTFSTTDTGDEMYGAIATFMAPSGGGGTPKKLLTLVGAGK